MYHSLLGVVAGPPGPISRFVLKMLTFCFTEEVTSNSVRVLLLRRISHGVCVLVVLPFIYRTEEVLFPNGPLSLVVERTVRSTTSESGREQNIPFTRYV